MSTLHPVVQLRFGDDWVTTIPPENLIEFEHVGKAEGSGSATFTFIDPTYVELERKILLTDSKREGVFYRWGYPLYGLDHAPWRSLYIDEYLPTIGSGMRIVLTGRSTGTRFFNLIQSGVRYKGSISTVALKVANDMGYTDKDKIFIEETDDDLGIEPQALWPMGNKSVFDFLRWLQPKAKSKRNPQGSYQFYVTNSGEFHFHTQLFEDGMKIRKFQVRAGDETIEFTPSFSSSVLGTIATSNLGATFDPRTKSYKQRVNNRQTLSLSNRHDVVNGKTMGPPSPFTIGERKITDSIDEMKRNLSSRSFKPTNNTAHGGHCSGKQPINERANIALQEQEDAVKRLQASAFPASLVNVGTPELVGMDPSDRFYDISVVLPVPPDQGSIHPHWSGGRYFVKEVRHTITGSYVITSELIRATAGAGADTAKTKTVPVKQEAKLIV